MNQTRWVDDTVARARAATELAGFTAAACQEARAKRQIGTMLAIAALQLIAQDGLEGPTPEDVAGKALADFKAAIPGVASAPDFPPVAVALKAVAPATLDHLKRRVGIA